MQRYKTYEDIPHYIEKKHILYALSEVSGLCAIIPRRCGQGFLKVPLGHHNSSFGLMLENLNTKYDFFGLDGYLYLDKGPNNNFYSKSELEKIKNTIIPALEKWFKLPSYQISRDEVFSILQQR